MSEVHEDVVQTVIDRIFQSDASYEKKMALLDALEPVIEKAYAQGVTSVKPVRLMTADDLDFDLP